jgi:uncharacterized OsmC-like protein
MSGSEFTNGSDTFAVKVSLIEGSAFRVDFDRGNLDVLTVNGRRDSDGLSGPSPTRLLAGAVGSCLASSLLHCLRKERVPIDRLTADVVTTMRRNDQGRLRITRIRAVLDPNVSTELQRVLHCAEVFESYCTVAESVRQGIDVRVSLNTG